METMGIMAILKEAYPMYYRNKSKEELNVAVNLWAEMFADDNINLVKGAVKAYIATDEKGFPPVIGQIKGKLYQITEPEQLSEVEAWGLVSKAIQNGCYNSEKEFDKLPEIVQRTIGSPARLKEWSQVDLDSLQTVVSSNFMRSFRAKSKNDEDYKRLPNDIKQLVSKTLLQIEGD